MNDNHIIISDELLSAFLDGNTSAEDTLRVLKAAEQDEDLREIIRISGEVDEEMAIMKPETKHIPMTAMAAYKKENYLCDIECWLKDKGMPLYNIGRLLEKNSLSVSRRYDSTIDDIVRLLDNGNQLIAVIDNSMLLHDVVDDTTQPNHAVAISSVSSSSNEITLFNPYTEEELTTYSLSSFLNAWAQSNNYLVVVNTTDRFVYEPYPIRLDDVTLDDDLTELQEAIAENAHEIWAKARTDQGWTYGPERNDQKKETPDMVPYCNLPESEKLYDREMAMQTLKLVKKLGFEIKKK